MNSQYKLALIAIFCKEYAIKFYLTFWRRREIACFAYPLLNKQQDSFVSCALSDFFAMCCGGVMSFLCPSLCLCPVMSVYVLVYVPTVYVLVPGEVYIVGSSTPRPSACSELILLQF